MRADVVMVLEVAAGGVALKVSVIDPPPGHALVSTPDVPPPGAAVSTRPAACVRVVPMMPWVAAALTPVAGVSEEGADGVPPPQPAARPSAIESTPTR